MLCWPGITSITDASKTVEDYEMFEELYQSNELALPRSTLQFQWYDAAAINALNARVGKGDDFLKPGAIKVLLTVVSQARPPIHWNPTSIRRVSRVSKHA